jgi:hypothetical protein
MSVNSRLRAISLVVVVYALGIVSGVFAERGIRRRDIATAGATTPTGQGDESIPSPIEALGLTDAERESLRAVARRWRPRAGEVIDSLRGQVARLEDGMFQEMLCALPSDKRKAYRDNLVQNNYDPAIIAKRFLLIDSGHCPVERR